MLEQQLLTRINVSPKKSVIHVPKTLKPVLRKKIKIRDMMSDIIEKNK